MTITIWSLLFALRVLHCNTILKSTSSGPLADLGQKAATLIQEDLQFFFKTVKLMNFASAVTTVGLSQWALKIVCKSLILH